MMAQKIMLLGEIGVGKTSIAKRLAFDRFDIEYKPTIGVDVYQYVIPDAPGEPGMRLIVWDTDGNFSDAIFRHRYVREANGALIISDLARPGTVDAMARLGEGFAEALPGRHFTFILNKTDLVASSQRPPLPAVLARPGADVVPTSALTGENVRDAFHATARILRRRAS